MKSSTFGPSFRCLWFWMVQDTTQPEELLAGFTGLESSGSGTGLTSPAAPWDFCTKINTLHLCSSQYATFTFSIMHIICSPPQMFHNLCFSFLLVITDVPRQIENNADAKSFFGGERQIRCIVGNVEVAYPKPPLPPGKRVNARAFDFFENFHPSSPVCWHFRWSNAPTASASKSVISLTHHEGLFKNFLTRQTVHSNIRNYPTKQNRNILRSLRKLFYTEFSRSNKIVHSSKSTFNGLFQRLSDAPTNQ